MTAVVIRLFSAYAEVFPSTSRVRLKPASFLCLRRGVSDTSILQYGRTCFSLPTQRCFSVSPRVSVIDWLFSAYAEVFPPARVPRSLTQPFLCLRRGVSRLRSRLRFYAAFSLPTQRCFFCGLDCIPPGLLFSAYAEVFPTYWRRSKSYLPFLCLRRGVSHPYRPKTRRPKLFSAYAEVFL